MPSYPPSPGAKRRARNKTRSGSSQAASSQPALQRHPDPKSKAPSAPTVEPLPEARPISAAMLSKSFEELGVPAPIIESLKLDGILKPFPIQAVTLRDSLGGRDVLGRGRTGSGKTLAFAIPTIATLAARPQPRAPMRPRALVLVPTRELANQVTEVLDPIAKSMGMRTTTIYGGVGQGNQVKALKAGVDVVVACPGRLEDLIQQGFCKLDQIAITVLDEADHMADLGFLPAVRRLLDATPQGTQRMLFSATLDRGVDVLVRRYLSEPVVHAVDPEVAPVSTMTHHVFAVSAADKANVVQALAGGKNRSLLFMRTKHGAKKLAKQLSASGIPAVELHGNLSQNARTRNLDDFSQGTVRVLVATDIAARGIHVDDLGLVVHVDPPAEHKAYLHRSGRTARAGAEGVVVTIMTPDQASATRTLTKEAGIKPLISQITPTHELIRELVGEPAPFRAPRPVAAAQPQPQGSGRSSGERRDGANPKGLPNSNGRSSGERRDGANPKGLPNSNGRPGRRAGATAARESAASAGPKPASTSAPKRNPQSQNPAPPKAPRSTGEGAPRHDGTPRPAATRPGNAARFGGGRPGGPAAGAPSGRPRKRSR